MTDFEKILHLLRFGLVFKKVTLASINDWAARKINDQIPDDIIFALSTARTKNEIIELISEKVIWNYSDSGIRNLILSYYKIYLANNPALWMDIEKELMEYFQLLDFTNGNERTDDFLYYLADDWHLRKDGLNGLLTMPDYLTDNLKAYNDYDILKEFLTREGLLGYET